MRFGLRGWGTYQVIRSGPGFRPHGHDDGYSQLVDSALIMSMGDTGLELYPNSPRNTQLSKQATHNPTHRLHQTEDITPELQHVIAAWPALPAAVRHSLLTIIDVVGGHPDEAPK